MASETAQHGLGPRANTALRQTFISLRNRNFKLFFIGQTISNSGNWLTNVALTLLVLKLTHSGLAVGLLAACQFGPILFLSPAAGALADRIDKRIALFWTQGLEMGQSVGLAICAFLPHPPLVALYALAIWGGMLLSFDNPLRRSFVGEMVRDEDLPNAVVLYSTIVNTSRIFGPALAGVLVITVGYGWCFAIDATSYIAVLACLALMRASELHRGPLRPREKGAIRSAVRYIAASPVLWINFAILVIVQLFSYGFTVTLPLFVKGPLHGNDAEFTFLYALFGAGAVVCALIVARRNLVRLRDILVGSVALGATMLLLSTVPNTLLAAPAAFLVGMGSILYMTATTANLQVRSERRMHGRLLALQMAFLGGTAIVGGPLMGWIADVWGGRAPMIVGGVAALAAGMLGYLAALRYVRPGERKDAEAHADEPIVEILGESDGVGEY